MCLKSYANIWTIRISRACIMLLEHRKSHSLSFADPPKLTGIRNFTTFNTVSEDTEQSAVLECTIEQTLTASAVLEWRRNGTLLLNSPKYVLPAPLLADNSNRLVYMLVVRELADSDIGAYECWLYSNYSFLQSRPEIVVQVWILESGTVQSADVITCVCILPVHPSNRVMWWQCTPGGRSTYALLQ